MASDAPSSRPAVARAISAFLATCESSNTRAAYGADLGHLAAWCRQTGTVDLLTIDVGDVARYRAACELAGASPATVARRLSAFASFSAFQVAMNKETAFDVDTRIARPAITATSTASVLDDDEADALLAGADSLGPRFSVLVRLLMLDGLKVGELINADASDVNGRPPHATLALREDGRVIDLETETTAAIRRYLARRREGPLLLSERRGAESTRLTRFGLDYLVKQIAHTAGITRPVSGNTLRRRYVMAAYAGGTDIETISRRAGHADSRTTRRYLATGRD